GDVLATVWDGARLTVRFYGRADVPGRHDVFWNVERGAPRIACDGRVVTPQSVDATNGLYVVSCAGNGEHTLTLERCSRGGDRTRTDLAGVGRRLRRRRGQRARGTRSWRRSARRHGDCSGGEPCGFSSGSFPWAWWRRSGARPRMRRWCGRRTTGRRDG